MALSLFQQHQPSQSLYVPEEETHSASQVMTVVSELLEAFKRLHKSSIGSVVLVKIGTAVTCMLAGMSRCSEEVVESMHLLLKTQIGSYCDPDITCTSEGKESLSYVSMMNAPAKLFEEVTKSLAPHYSRCRLVSMDNHEGDTCGCSGSPTMHMFRYGLNVAKYTWFVSDLYLIQPFEFLRKLEILGSIAPEVTKRFVFRYVCLAPLNLKLALNPDIVSGYLGCMPFGVPLVYLTLDANKIMDTPIPSITPKMWYMFRQLMQNKDNAKTENYDRDMRTVRYILKGANFSSHIPGGTFVEKLTSVTQKPLDIMFLMSYYLISTSKLTDRKTFANFAEVLRKAFVEIRSRKGIPKRDTEMRFCENVFSSSLNALYAVSNGESMIELFSFLDTSVAMPATLIPVVASCMGDALICHTLNPRNMGTVIDILKNPICMNAEGGPLSALVRTCKLNARLCYGLVDVMNSKLTTKEILNLVSYTDSMGRNVFHSVIITTCSNSQEIEYISYWLLKWDPGILLQHDCNDCTPLDYRYDVAVMESITSGNYLVGSPSVAS